MTTYTNAGIQSKHELSQRLINGEVFYSKYNSEVKFDDNFCHPFRFGQDIMNTMWDSYMDFKIKANWYDNIPKEGVLCWVSDDDNGNKDYAVMITQRNASGRFAVTTGTMGWKYVEPVRSYETLYEEGEE